MSVQQELLKEVEDTKKWVDKAEGVYKRDLRKRIELINWVLEEMKKRDINICSLIEIRTNQIIDEINKKDSIIESDTLDSEVRILDYILDILCSNQLKKLEML